jgi:acyl-CoA synthetase (AMP-forming)/AMP-acid ligase II
MAEADFIDRFAGYETVRLHGLGDVLREHRRSRPHCLALVQRDRQLTYAEFDARVNRLAGLFRTAGVGRRGRVLWMGQNSLRLIEALLACAKLGAIFCAANWRQSTLEMSHVLADFHPQVVIWQDVDLGDMARACRAADDKERFWLQQDGPGEEAYEAAVARYPDADDHARISPDEPLLALYSSAFDGKPRAALLTHSAILFQDLVMGRAQDIDHRTVMLNSGPLFHLGTMMGMFATFHHGGTNIFIRRMDAETALQLIERHRVTHAFLPGPTLEQIREINAGGLYDVSSLFERSDAGDWTSKSAMCAPKHAPIVRAPGGYGQTEVMGHVILRAFGGEGGAGRPHPMVQVLVADDEGREVAIGEVGEILVRGPMVMAGYHCNVKGVDTCREVAGWHRTNDLGRRLPDGSLAFVGPKQVMIKTGKENVYPAEVENCLRQHPAVRDVCVIGVPDPVWQQNIKAVVELEPRASVSTEDLIAYCKARLASYKKPKIVEMVEALPRVDGTIDRKAADALFGGGGYPSMG